MLSPRCVFDQLACIINDILLQLHSGKVLFLLTLDTAYSVELQLLIHFNKLSQIFYSPNFRPFALLIDFIVKVLLSSHESFRVFF
jgi:hypothetical protein